jgi:transposase
MKHGEPVLDPGRGRTKPTSNSITSRRAKYGCLTCENVVVQAPAPARLSEGGLPTEATVAQVLVAKYADHLALYRQAQIYARHALNSIARP